MTLPEALPLDNGHASSIVICAVLFPSLATLSVVARFIARWTKGVGYGLDDYFVVLALMALYGQMTILILGTIYGGVGHHVSDVLPDNIEFQYKMLAAVQFTFGTSVGLMKMSICLLLVRVFAPKQSFRIAAWCVLALCAAWMFMVISIGAGLCRPFSYNWNKNQPGKCGNLVAAFISIAATDITVDTIIIALPMPWLWGLQMATRTKIGLTLVFALGILDIVVAILRIYYLVNTSYAPGADFLWSSTGTFVWSVIEPSLGVIVACAPVLGTALRQCIPFLRSTVGSVGKPTWAYSKSKRSMLSQDTFRGNISSPIPLCGFDSLERGPGASTSRAVAGAVSDDEELLDPRSQRISGLVVYKDTHILVRNDYSVTTST